jgi:sulfur relay (sulfurtransferase) DsrC/TusE family protein
MKYGTECRFKFPKYPTLKTIISKPAKVLYPDEKVKNKKLSMRSDVLTKVKFVLTDEEKMKNICKIGSKEIGHLFKLKKVQMILENYDANEIFKKDDFSFTRNLWQWTEKEKTLNKAERQELLEIILTLMESAVSNAMEAKEKRLIQVLKEADLNIPDDELIQTYELALSIGDNSYNVHYKRDVDEIFVNQYNEEFIVAWNGNIDFQICLDHFAIITYISDYYSKDESGTSAQIKEALRGCTDPSLKERYKLVASTFLSHRQMGPCECIYRLSPQLHLKDSNTQCVFVHTGFPENRSKFLAMVDEVFPGRLEIDGGGGEYWS